MVAVRHTARPPSCLKVVPMPATEHIEIRPDRCGGKPCIAGTRIRVWDVHVWHDLEGRRPEEIVAAFPQISVADVHAALAYYLDHCDEVERQIAEGDALATKLATAQGPTPFTRLRDSMNGGADAAIPPG
jgi:uncharacterized protein (DUF433 family)